VVWRERRSLRLGRRRGDVTASFTLLIDEAATVQTVSCTVSQIPATGKEITSLLMSGSFETKFDMGLTPESVVRDRYPEITYTADDIGEGVSGDTGGEAPATDSQRQASGTAPISPSMPRTATTRRTNEARN